MSDSPNGKKYPSDLQIVAARGIVETSQRLGRKIPPSVLRDSKLQTSDERREFAESA